MVLLQEVSFAKKHYVNLRAASYPWDVDGKSSLTGAKGNRKKPGQDDMSGYDAEVHHGFSRDHLVMATKLILEYLKKHMFEFSYDVANHIDSHLNNEPLEKEDVGRIWNKIMFDATWISFKGLKGYVAQMPGTKNNDMNILHEGWFDVYAPIRICWYLVLTQKHRFSMYAPTLDTEYVQHELRKGDGKGDGKGTVGNCLTLQGFYQFFFKNFKFFCFFSGSWLRPWVSCHRV